MTGRVVVAVVSVALAVGAAATAAPNPADLEAELVCPTCDTTLDQSNAPVAQRMKQLIRQHIAAGWTEAEIKADLVDQFGPGVLAELPKSGFDLSKPIVGYAIIPANPEYTTVVFALPVADEKAFTAFLKDPGDTELKPAGDGVFELIAKRPERMHRLDHTGPKASAQLDVGWFLFHADHHGGPPGTRWL